MRLLCLDIGSGTQDVLFLDTAQPAENAVQLVLPAPTVLIAQKIARATASGLPLVLTGETMGGGACTGALKNHLKAGLTAYATPEAARTFRDDLEEVTAWGVQLVSLDEISTLKPGAVIEMKDVAFDMLEAMLSHWEVSLKPDAVAVAVLDHGAAPRGESERRFRFRYLESLLKKNDRLDSLVFVPLELPDFLTRMLAVVRSLEGKFPLVLMDTGTAAVMGAPVDRTVAIHQNRLLINLGNSHTLAFHLDEDRVLGLFEHHTSALSSSRVEALIKGLVSGKLRNSDVWEEGGHGSLVLEKRGNPPFVSATGPRRSLLASSEMNPYFAAPFGSMMLTGCFGLARGIAIRFPEWRDELDQALLG